VYLSFNFKDTLFRTFFDMMKNEQARAHPLFSHGPHSKHDVEKAIKNCKKSKKKLQTDQGTF
jgi:hypothetical protein